MAIYAYVGLPRQGKSYNVVAEQILPALKEGRRVVTNIPLNESAIRALGGIGEIVQVDQEALAKTPGPVIDEHMTAGSVVVLDELWRFLPQGLTAKNVDSAWKTLFAEHGHRIDAQGRMMQIVLVTQDLSQVSAFARALVERTFVVTKLTAIGSTKKFRVDVYAGNVTGLKPPISKRLSEQFGSYDSKIFGCYTSRTMAEGAAANVDESVLDKRGSVWRHPVIRFGLPAAAMGLAWGLWQSYEFFFGRPERAAAAELDAAQHRPPAAVKRVVQAQTSSGRYRVAGILRASNDVESTVILDRCDGAPGRIVNWYVARCTDHADGSTVCEFQGERYEYHGAIDDCRLTDEPRVAEIRWFPSDAGGSRKSVSVVPAAPVDE